MIDRIDQMDGDPDVELNGDETDLMFSEDDFADAPLGYLGEWGGPGCPISDPGGCDLER